MPQDEYNVGDRVQLTVNHPYGNPDLRVGSTRTICVVRGGGDVGVGWDEPVDGGHTCYVRDADGVDCPEGYGWFVYYREIEHIYEPVVDDSSVADGFELMAFISAG